ncbi:hypothetical protein J8J42_05545 [Chryseobacterium sp. cx-311]|nr:hypothetical protein [Marnyiella aurantia]MBP0612507.1 hypothetical protein [Marnyiella aurantia]
MRRSVKIIDIDIIGNLIGNPNLVIYLGNAFGNEIKLALTTAPVTASSL